MSLTYAEFLAAKARLATASGLDCSPDEVHPLLKPHQKDMVCWGVRGGRRAWFASFGLGKSLVQLEAIRIILKKLGGGRGLIVCPLGVRQEFARDARMVGLETRFIRSAAEASADGIYLTNYEPVRDGKLDPRGFDVISLDEAAILRGFGGTKTFRTLMGLYEGSADYRFVATATPSPNEYVELLAYAAFLDVMDIGQAKTRFFKRDSAHADRLTLHSHMEQEFWLWVSSWALFLENPSDLGYSNEGYELPALDVRWHEVPSIAPPEGVFDRDGRGQLFRDAAFGVQDAAKEKRGSIAGRVAKVMEIIRDGREGAVPAAPADRGLQDVSPGIRPGALPREEIRGDAGAARGTAGVSAAVPGAEPGSLGGEAPGSAEARVPGGPGEAQGPRAALEGSEPGACPGTAAPLPGGEPGADQPAQPGLVCGEQGACVGAEQAPEAGSLRADGRGVPGTPGEPGRAVRDLREPGSGSGEARGALPGGPRSQDGSSAWAVVPELQQRPRPVRGRSGTPHSGSGLPDQLVIWCDLNEEQRGIERGLAQEDISVSSLHGSLDVDDREELLTAWRDRDTSVLLTKPSMYGAGVNLQQCHTMIFAGIGFKFSEFVQGIHRIRRFLQDSPCTVHIIYTEAEREIRARLERKWAAHDQLVARMGDIIREYGLSGHAMEQALTRTIGVERAEVAGPGYLLVRNDAVLETAEMKDDSAAAIITSIPFGTQFEYSPAYEDFGHTEDSGHFWQQMDYLSPELLRVLQPGRMMCVHVKDRIVPGGMLGLGFQSVAPFHAEAITHYRSHGFVYMGMITVITDVVRENNQTYRLGWTENCKDGSKMGAGMPEYVLLFRRPPTDSANGYADVPVVKGKEGYSRSRWQVDAHGFWRSDGNRPLTPEEIADLPHEQIFKLFRGRGLEEVYDYEGHIGLGEALEAKRRLPTKFMLLQPPSWHPDVLTDVARMRTLNMMQERKGQQQHLCPMPFDLVDRLLTRFTMEGETVYDPFMGIGTVPMMAVQAGRRGLGVELSLRYFTDAVGYVKAEADKARVPTLFDLLEAEPGHPDREGCGPSDAPSRARPVSVLPGSTDRHAADRGPDDGQDDLGEVAHA